MRQKSKIYSLAVCLFANTFFVILLFFSTKRFNHSIGNFIRLSPPHSLEYIKDIKLKSANFDFIGKSENDIFLGSRDLPTTILKSDIGLKAINLIQLRTRIPFDLYSADVSFVEPFKFYLIDGTQPLALTAQLQDSFLHPLSIGKHPFQKAIPLDNEELALNQFDRRLKQNIYKLYDSRNECYGNNFYAPEKKGDGVFSIDGIMHFEPNTQKLVYVYFYQNRFDCLDKHLNVIYHGRTIDNTSDPKFKVATIGSEGRQMLTNSPLVVNKQSCLSGEYLFVRSGVAATNDPKNIMDNCAVIDIYSIRSGKYLQSLYAYNFRGFAMRSFIVTGDFLFSLYGPYLSLWRIHLLGAQAG